MERSAARMLETLPDHAREAGRYAVAGILNTIVGYAVFWMFNQWAGLHISLANALGYAAGLMVAYFLNRYFVFRGARGSRTVLLFLVCVAVSFSLNQAVLLALYYATDLHAGVIQLFGMATYMAAFFLLNKFVVFRRPAAQGPDQTAAGSGARSGSSTK